MEIETGAQAHIQKLAAQKKRLQVRDHHDPQPTLDQRDFVEADDMDKQAEAFLALSETPERGTGGELIPHHHNGVAGVYEAVKHPDYVSVEASIDRIRLADNCGAINLALDAAETAGAKNALEQMLTHQMAAAHKMAMDLITRAGRQCDTVEMARLTNAAARLIDSFQKGLLAMNKMRSGGKQVVTVQHVQVADGGQAVINGAINTGGISDGGGAKK